MLCIDAHIVNDFDRPLFILYKDRHRHFTVIQPDNSSPLSVIVKGKKAEIALFFVCLCESSTHPCTEIKFQDLRIIRNDRKD